MNDLIYRNQLNNNSSLETQDEPLVNLEQYRNAVDLSPQDRQRVLGTGIARFFGGLAKPGYGSGFNGALAALNASFDPAMQAAQQEEASLRQMNAQALNMAMKEQQERFAREARDRQMALAERTLAETQRHHASMEKMGQQRLEGSPEAAELKDAAKKIFETSGDRVVPIDTLPASIRKEALRDVKDYTDKYNKAIEAEEMINRMEKIIERNPNVVGGFKFVAQNAYAKDPGLFNTALSKFITSEKDRSDLMELGSLTKNLVLTDLGKIPGSPNQMLEKFLISAAAGAHQTPEAIRRGLKRARNGIAYAKSEYGKGSDYGSLRMQYLPGKKEFKEDDSYTLDDILESHPELEELSKTNPEAVLKAWGRLNQEGNSKSE